MSTEKAMESLKVVKGRDEGRTLYGWALWIRILQRAFSCLSFGAYLRCCSRQASSEKRRTKSGKVNIYECLPSLSPSRLKFLACEVVGVSDCVSRGETRNAPSSASPSQPSLQPPPPFRAR